MDDTKGGMLSPPDMDAARGTTAQGPVTVLSWTGVIVKGASTVVPLHVQLQDDIGVNEDNLCIILGSLPCRVAVSGNTLVANVPVGQLMTGKTVIKIYHERGNQRIELPLTTPLQEMYENAGLPCSVIDLVAVAYPDGPDTEGECIEIRGNSLAAIATAEDYHESFQQLPNDPGHYVSILITKSHPSDFASVFVFGLKNGTARLDRYECAEANLEYRHKWDFIDTCQLGEVVVAAQGSLTVVTLADGVEFCFEPQIAKQAFSANLHVGPIIFAAITLLRDEWIQWFSKHWVPAVAIGNPEESGMIERFAAPTISSLVKRANAQPMEGHYVSHNRTGTDKASPPPISPPKIKSPPRPMPSPHAHAGGRGEQGGSTGLLGPRPTSGPKVRNCILTHLAPEMALYNRGEMVESKFPKRVANLNMSPDIALALRPDRER
jgi:hypothetical protein